MKFLGFGRHFLEQLFLISHKQPSRSEIFEIIPWKLPSYSGFNLERYRNRTDQLLPIEQLEQVCKDLKYVDPAKYAILIYKKFKRKPSFSILLVIDHFFSATRYCNGSSHIHIELRWVFYSKDFQKGAWTFYHSIW